MTPSSEIHAGKTLIASIFPALTLADVWKVTEKTNWVTVSTSMNAKIVQASAATVFAIILTALTLVLVTKATNLELLMENNLALIKTNV